MSRSKRPAGQLIASLLLCMNGSFVLAQESPRGPAFAVASIKPVDRTAAIEIGTSVYPDGRILIRAASVKSLIASAFGLASWQIAGGEPWTQSDLYVVEAKPSEEWQSRIVSFRTTWTGIEDDTLRAMLQALLVERFQLKTHRETKMGAVYVLKQSGKTLRLRRPPQGAADTRPPSNLATAGYAGGKWSIDGMSMRQLAEFASAYYLHAPVLDQTGLEGPFSYRQAAEDIDPVYTSNDNFLRMISDVGLRLDRTEGQVETLVIDAVARPSAN